MRTIKVLHDANAGQWVAACIWLPQVACGAMAPTRAFRRLLIGCADTGETFELVCDHE